MKQPRPFVTFLVLVVVHFAVVPGVRGEIIIFFEENGGGENPRGLYNFDTETGSSELRCRIGGSERFFGMDMRPSDGVVFAADLWGSGLWTIDIDTGLTDRIATIKPHIERPEGLAFHPQTGELFVSSVHGELYTVDPHTASSQFIGASELTIRGHSFSPDGSTLFAYHEGSGRAYSVDPATGAATYLSAGIPSTVPEDTTFTPSGGFYGTDYFGNLYSLDPVTGLAEHIGTTCMDSGLLGLIPVPEPTTLILLGLGGLALLSERRAL